MKLSELKHLIKQEIRTVLNEVNGQNVAVFTKSDTMPGMSLMQKNINGVDTTMVQVKAPFYYNGAIPKGDEKLFKADLESRFSQAFLEEMQKFSTEKINKSNITAKPTITVIPRKFNGVDTLIVNVENYFYYNGIVSNSKKFLENLQRKFEESFKNSINNYL